MKTFISLITAALLGLAFAASGRSFDFGDFTAILFTVGLIAWTAGQYSREPRPLLVARPIRLPVPVQSRVSLTATQRLAA